MKIIFFLFYFVLATGILNAQRPYATQEIIYGRKDGLALTMVQLKPFENNNGKAIIYVVSGNWISGYNRIGVYTIAAQPYLESGYSVFLVMHGSQPRYAIPDQVADLQRATRFIRFHATEYGIDPDHLGITGSSSGGNLALLVATADDRTDPKQADSVGKVSARVQAIAVFFPPTDFFNWGAVNASFSKNEKLLQLAGVAGAFDFKIWNDTTKLYSSITDSAKRVAIYREISPIYAVSVDDPPALIVHGDNDRVVPLQQSESIIARFKESKVPSRLIIKKGGGHGWNGQEAETREFIKWFDQYLK